MYMYMLPDDLRWPMVYASCIQVGNGCVGNEVGGCGHETGLKIHIDFYHGHALFPDVSSTLERVVPTYNLLFCMHHNINTLTIYNVM